MPVFEIEKDDLLGLDEGQLEELIARLCEAEIAAKGHAVSSVRWGGSLTAADGGVDVRVTVKNPTFVGDFIRRRDTVYQAKVPSMAQAAIKKEISGKDTSKDLFQELAISQGAYVIVSLKDDLAPAKLTERRKLMSEEVDKLVTPASVALDFFDRSALHQWLRQHVSVQLWVRRALGTTLSGWRPFERWTNVPPDADDTLIVGEGLYLSLPGKNSDLPLAEGIPAVRNLILTSSKSIRIAGLSGVGKTRFVQALFEEGFKTDHLDRTKVIYGDVGFGVEPSATVIVDTLVAENRDAILVLDNCAKDEHSLIVNRISRTKSAIKLITIEYDIRDDTPQTTEVVRLTARGTEITEQLVARRYPQLGSINARRIADFSGGNARLALALADALPDNVSLAGLSDEELFERLFEQRHASNNNLREQAEVLSLVYSFSTAEDEEGVNELAVLGGLCEVSARRMARTSNTLLERQIAQQRGRWRAVLPHAIANRLAADALRHIPVDEVLRTFEGNAGERMLRSFSRRIGFLHTSPQAREISRRWLQPDGLLHKTMQLNGLGAAMLANIAPIDCEIVLECFESQKTEILAAVKDIRKQTEIRRVTSLISKIAYEPELFGRAISLLLEIADEVGDEDGHDGPRKRVCALFQIRGSGTHATLEQRVDVLEACLADSKRHGLALNCLATSLETENFEYTNLVDADFGARPRDYGARPYGDEAIAWLSRFLNIAAQIAFSDDISDRTACRGVIASQFGSLWGIEKMRPMLIELAEKLSADGGWLEGWRAVKGKVHYDKSRSSREGKAAKDDPDLVKLCELLAPSDLEGRVRAIALAEGHRIFALDEEFDLDDPKKYEASGKRLAEEAFRLGQDVAADSAVFDAVVNDLFEQTYAPNRIAFGRGLAAASSNRRLLWQKVTEGVRAFGSANFNDCVLSGILMEISQVEPALAQALLDEIAEDDLLRRRIVGLTPADNFSLGDFQRCERVFDAIGLELWCVDNLLWRDNYAVISKEDKARLANKISAEEGGASVLLHAFSMMLHGAARSVDNLGPDLRALAIKAAAIVMGSGDSGPRGTRDYDLEKVLTFALASSGTDAEEKQLLDGLFSRMERRYGFFPHFEKGIQVIAKSRPDAFLDRLMAYASRNEADDIHWIDNSLGERAPLDEVSAADLAAWCGKGNDVRRWKLVTRAITVFEEDKEGGMRLSEQARSLVRMCPEPVAIIENFGLHLSTRSWSGNRSVHIEQRASGLSELLKLEDSRVVTATEELLSRAAKIADQERKREQVEDAEREQTFE
ncbi:hypothetical protein PL336_10460 [Sulfitobacter faviae]|uniref:ATP-binding protein n=1 Tax=Sulfitobacter faviae TaxID=1775881 RepID=A0AAX3LKL8_9RHOB|nr:hypothetical protein [Sulfitobacter faviae]WCE69224.1 hypothetical protein PL336_10460 [Sulfitobacter faviae]